MPHAVINQLHVFNRVNLLQNGMQHFAILGWVNYQQSRFKS